MSNYVDIACLTCNKEAGLSINRGWDECLAVMEAAPELAAFAKKADALWRFVDFGKICGIAQFIAEHTGERHDLVVRDEYGDVCRGCIMSTHPDVNYNADTKIENKTSCRLPKHEGAHSRFEKTP